MSTRSDLREDLHYILQRFDHGRGLTCPWYMRPCVACALDATEYKRSLTAYRPLCSFIREAYTIQGQRMRTKHLLNRACPS